MIAPPSHSTSLQQWRQLCYVTTLDVPDAERLLTIAADVVCAGYSAVACVITYCPPNGTPVKVERGVVPDEIREVIAQAVQRLTPGQLLPVSEDFLGISLVTMPLTVCGDRVGVLHVIAPTVPVVLDDLQLVAVLLTNALARQVQATEAARQARETTKRQIAVQAAVTRILAESATLSDATPIMLQAFCESLRWDIGEFWAVDHEAGVLRCSTVWHAPRLEVTRFIAASREVTYAPGVGLPGQCWVRGEPVWRADVVNDVSLPRSLIAAKARLHSAFCIPILSDSQISGVIVLFSRKIRQPEPDLMTMMAVFGSQIGQFIERKRAEAALKEAQDRLATVVANAPIVLFALDQDGIVTLAEGKGLNALGLEAAGVVGRSIFALSDGASTLHTHAQRALAGETFTAIAQYGDVAFETRWTSFKDETGTITGVTAVATDITGRLRIEAALRSSEEQFRATFEQAAVGMGHVGLDGRWLRVNQRLCEIVGYSEAELLALTFQDITHPDDLGSDLSNLHRMLINEIPQYVMEKRYIRKDGTLVWVELTVSLIRSDEGTPHYCISVVEDITARKAAEAENAKLAEALRVERDRLLRREVEVRTQIGRDLHDGPVQQVAVAGMTVQYVRRMAERAPERLGEALDDLESQLQRTMRDLRTVLYELRPLGIVEEGLVMVLQQYIAKVRDPNGLRIHLNAPATLQRMSPDHEAAMFIIIQEALNNVRKHAGAEDVWLTLSDDGTALCASVHDNGRGFDVQQVLANYIQRGSFGLLNMSERAQLLGGSCTITVHPDGGTQVDVRIPFVTPRHVE